MSKYVYNFLIFVFLILFSFENTFTQHKKKVNIHETSNNYFPLGIGNSYTYDFFSQDNYGNEIFDTLNITIIDSLSCYFLFDKYFTYFCTLVFGDSSLFRIEDSSATRRFNDKIIKWYDFTASVGDTWLIPVQENRFFPPETFNIVAELESKNENYVLFGNTLLNCYRFSFRGTTNISDKPWRELFAPEIGLIKIEIGSPGEEYSSYTLNRCVIDGIPLTVNNEQSNYSIINNYSLYQNYPNPFNERTKISYTLWECNNRVTILIYNILGEKIKTFLLDNQNAGRYNVIWDGKNDEGKNVPSGIYIYMLMVNMQKSFKKAIIIR